MSKLMEKDVYNAAVNGDLTIFSNKIHEQLLKKTYQNNNIIHIAAQHQQLDFIKAALNNFPSTPTCESLLRDQNYQGNTPLHIVAQVGEGAIIDQLYKFFLTQCGDAGGRDLELPWRIVNSNGNTPAHVALLYGNVSVAMYLIQKDGSLARLTNHSKETLLHLAIEYHVYDDPETEATSSSKNVMPIIDLLLKVESSLACWTNRDGSTPLHQAASIDPAYCIGVIKAILIRCPEAAAVQDERSEHTVLHLLTNHQVASYEQGKELLQIPQVKALINIKDHQGDTPLHLAARNRDTIMVGALLRSSPKLGLKNKSGVSLRSLLPQFEETPIRETTPVEQRLLRIEDIDAAIRGDVAFLNEALDSFGMDFLSSQTSMGGNILHILMPFEFSEEVINDAVQFIREAIQALPSLISQQDCNGNTPLHLVAEKFFSYLYGSLIDKYYNMGELEVLDYSKGGPHSWPCRLKNVKGDTPLHIAVREGNYRFANQLLKVDKCVAGYVNSRNQTPLHLLSLRSDCDVEEVDVLIRNLFIGKADLPSMQDEDGLTPVLTAIRERNFLSIKTLHQQYPDSTQNADFKGRTLWHLFGSRPLERDVSSAGKSVGLVPQTEACKFLLEQDVSGQIRRLMATKDNDGNTPLHLAIANQQFDFAQFFLDNWTIDWGVQQKYDALLSVENKEGVSSYNLIGSAEHLPLQFEKSLFKKGNLLYGHRSLYGVPTTKTEQYANTIGVIAALLATITFTAAFTVPGGLDSSKGTPLLLGKAAFQVFMVADVVAMCTSVMVLFCLLWIMTTGHKKETLLLLDVSVFLLQTSFHATLVTFMTGLYVTTIPIVPAIAISTCVVCTLLIILMHKRLVMLTIVPFFGMLIILGRKIR